MFPEFDSLTTTAGIEILDPIESRRFTLRTSTRVAPSTAGTDEFPFPVATACEVRTDELELPYPIPVDVRAPDGSHLDSISPPTHREFPDGEYLLDLHAPIKLYLLVDGPLTVDADSETVAVRFGEPTTVRVGARSYHTEPAGTITVPDDPEAMMEAVTAFSSALKTTSPERAWPTLRGHPPRVERGDELSIPEELVSPQTGITIEVPPEYGHVYAVAPLAYYLGADVVSGSVAALRTDDGLTERLGEEADEVAETAGDLLQRMLLLDCVTRTEGYYPVDLHERDVLERHVDLDLEALYHSSPSERLRTYLSVPDEAVAAITPTWHRVTHVQPGPSAVELLPYVVKDLSLVRIQPPGNFEWTPSEEHQTTEEALQSFARGPTTARNPRATPNPGQSATSADDFLRSATPADDLLRSADSGAGGTGGTGGASGVRSPAGDDSPEFDGSERGVPGAGEYVPLPDVDALEQAYVGDKTPEGGAKLLAEAFDNEKPELADGVIDITVVCNDEQMREEWDTVSDIYCEREDVYVEVDSRFDVSTDELRELLTEDRDVLHFIGHIDGLGFECPDGILDAETVDETGATMVLLNGCRSHDQGIELVQAGANAVIVSLGDVNNEGAVEVGETLARLFYYGFSVGSSMAIVREYTSIGRDYLVLGDPTTEIAHSETGMPIVYHLDDVSDDETLSVDLLTYPTKTYGIGALYEPDFPNTKKMHLAVGFCSDKALTLSSLEQSLANHPQPFVVDGELTWSERWFSEAGITDR